MLTEAQTLFLHFQGLTIIAFNDGRVNSKTIREVLSLGPTFVVMKFVESRFFYYRACGVSVCMISFLNI